MDLEDNDLDLEIRDGVANITLNRAKQRNAFTSAMIEALDTMLDKIDADKNCRVIVLRGKGGHFCSGWDFNDIHAMRSRGDDALQQQFKTNLEVLNKLENHSRVTISLVEGAVMGFGFSLVARSDIVLAPESCVTALPEIALGIVPAIVMVDAQRVLPQKTALEWVLSGRTYDDAKKMKYYEAVKRGIDLLTLEQTMLYGGNFGSAQYVIDALKVLEEEMGVDHYIGWFRIPTLDRNQALDAMRFFAAEVMPEFSEDSIDVAKQAAVT